MYWFDRATQETVFEFATLTPATPDAPVELLCGRTATRLERHPMRRCDDRWVIRLPLPLGYYAYGFAVNGRIRRDPQAGCVRAARGPRLGLALVPGQSAEPRFRAIRPGAAVSGYFHI